MTYGILNSINQKNRLYKRLKKARSNSPEYDIKKLTFNTYRNSLRRIIYLAKKDYFCKKFSESKNNKKKTWQTLNKALNRLPSQFSPETLTIDNQICTGKKRMANSFNNYFSTICNRDEPINSYYRSYNTYLNNPQNKMLKFALINNDNTLQIISKLKPSHSSGHDSISINTLKIIMIAISPCITLIINQCLSSGIFPNKLKVTRVVPIFKKNNKTLIPISILPAISKIVENVIHSQLLEYL